MLRLVCCIVTCTARLSSTMMNSALSCCSAGGVDLVGPARGPGCMEPGPGEEIWVPLEPDVLGAVHDRVRHGVRMAGRPHHGACEQTAR